ncbi:MAG: hypothetical protein ACQESK_04350 [Bacteroidota bacterium]
MKKVCVIFIVVIFQFCASSKWKKFNSNIETELDIIASEIAKGDKPFYKSKIYSIDKKYDSDRVVCNVYDESGTIGLSVVPDSIEMHLNNYREFDDKLFLYNSKTSKKTNREIFYKLNEYGVSLDSCLFKYRYQKDEPQKYFQCTINNEAKIDIHPSYIEFIFLKNDESDIGKYLKKEKF